MKKSIKFFGIALLLLFLFIPAASLNAAVFINDERVIISEYVHDDLYVAGKTIIIENTIEGDLYAVGETITIRGEVEGDLFAIGRKIVIKGKVGDDAKIAAQDIVIMGTIGDDVFAAGETVSFEEGSRVGGSAWAAGDHVIVDGSVDELLCATANTINFRGKVAGIAELEAYENIYFDRNAEILGDLNYSSPKEVSAASDVTRGKLTYKVTDEVFPFNINFSRENIYAFAGYAYLFVAWLVFILVLVTGVILLLIFKRIITDVVNFSMENMWRNMGIGFISIVVFPVLIAVTFWTLIGVPLSIFLVIVMALLLFISKVFAGFLIGSRLIHVTEKSGIGRVLGSFAVGVLVLDVIGLIPVLGWIFRGLVTLILFGGLVWYTGKKLVR